MEHLVGYYTSATYRCLEDLQKDSVDLCLTYCGWEQCEPGHRFGPNKREAYVLHMIREGKGTFEINNEKYTLGKGDAFLIPRGAEAWYEADMEDPWQYMWVGFVGIKSDECIRSAGFSEKSPVRKIKCLDEAGELIDQMIEYHQLSYADELKRNALLMMVFATLIDDYSKMQANHGAAKTHVYPGSVYVKHAMEFMTKNYEKKIKIGDLADYIGVNRSYLTSSFKNTIGCSPQEFLINLRIEKAKSLLKKTELPIKEISDMVGYSDQLAFSKLFKQYCNKSPKAYREQESRLIIKDKKGM